MAYCIIRFYKDGRKRLIDYGLTREQAQAHCKDPSTRKEGVWFDGFDEESNWSQRVKRAKRR